MHDFITVFTGVTVKVSRMVAIQLQLSENNRSSLYPSTTGPYSSRYLHRLDAFRRQFSDEHILLEMA